MKKIKLFFILFIFQTNAFSQSLTIEEGIATFEFNYPDAKSPKEISFRPQGLKVYFKNGKSRAEFNNGARWVIIVDPQKKEFISMGTPEHNIAIKMTFQEKEDNLTLKFGKFEIEKTSDTKDIAGYKCNKVNINYPAILDSITPRTMTMEVWVTNQLAASNNEYLLNDINGFIMEYTYLTLTDQEFRTILTCVKVEKATISDDLFKVPDDCKVVMWEDINK